MTPAPHTLTARTPTDLLAAVPVVLGFHPTRSVVMLTFGGSPTFHARLDLPDDDVPLDESALSELVASLVGPAVRHDVDRVVLVLYTDLAAGRPRADAVAIALAAGFASWGIEVIEVLGADGARWLSLTGRSDLPADGVGYDLASHPFTLDAVYAGLVTHASREELAASLTRDEVAADALAVVAAAQGTGGLPGAVEIAEILDRRLRSGRPTDRELARVLLAIRSPRVRDAAWVGIRREDAADHVRMWSDAVRRAPDSLLGGAASVLALACWVAGQGALAWCAIDRCREVDPDNTLADVVADLLRDAVPPAPPGELLSLDAP